MDLFKNRKNLFLRLTQWIHRLDSVEPVVAGSGRTDSSCSVPVSDSLRPHDETTVKTSSRKRVWEAQSWRHWTQPTDWPCVLPATVTVEWPSAHCRRSQSTGHWCWPPPLPLPNDENHFQSLHCRPPLLADSSRMAMGPWFEIFVVEKTWICFTLSLIVWFGWFCCCDYFLDSRGWCFTYLCTGPERLKNRTRKNWSWEKIAKVKKSVLIKKTQ